MRPAQARCEWWPLADALDDLLLAHERLEKRHGQTFRDLERRIEALILGDTSALANPQLVELGPLLFALTPSNDVTSLLREARAVGVL